MRWFAAALILSLAACGGDPAGSSSSSSGGSSGTTGAVDSAGTSSLSGSLAFDVKQSIEVTYAQSDGTVDTTWLEVDLTDDGSESCVVQEGGYSDGGGPTSLHHLLEISVDAPTGVQLGVAYPSLTTAQELNAVADGGGLARATLHPLHGAERLARLYLQLARQARTVELRYELRTLNGAPALLCWRDRQLFYAMWIDCDGERITAIHTIRHPGKLARIEAVTKHEGGASLH